MQRITSSEYADALRAVGVREGETVYFQADLRRLCFPEGARTREDVCDFFGGGLRRAVGPEGTLCANVANTEWAGAGVAFHREKTPSTSGALTEWLRSRPGAVRSLHPIASVGAWGPKAEELAGGAHFYAFGYDSPWGRLYRENALLVGLGFPTFSFNHFIECLAGVPYRYTKIFDVPVYDCGERVGGVFTMSVRYRHLPIVMAGHKLTRELVHDGRGREVRLGDIVFVGVRVADYVNEGLRRLRQDIHFLLEAPLEYPCGVPPFDVPDGWNSGKEQVR